MNLRRGAYEGQNDRTTRAKADRMAHRPTCQCGCGGETKLITHTSARRGLVKGEYARFIHGHNGFKDLATRFWSKVEKTDGCWLWRGSTNPRSGYGMLGVIEDGRKLHKYAHRKSWEMANGSIPPGLFVCHHCDVRNCVRPDHLFLGTHTDNMRDAASKGRLAMKPELRGRAKWVTPQLAEEVRMLTSQGLSERSIAARLPLNRYEVRVVLGRVAA